VQRAGLRRRRRLDLSLTHRPFGRLPDGREVDELTLANGRGLELSLIPLGGIVTALRCPDRAGRSANVVLGLPTLDDYLQGNPAHFGTLVGRYANRIAGGRFVLDGRSHELVCNEGPNTLHGGPIGFGRRWWRVASLPAADDVALELSLVSEDGDQGFPGRLELNVRYTLTPLNEWRIDYRARTDRPTVLNLTHHAYWNLAGGGSVLGHRLWLPASRFLAVDATLIPDRIAEVEGTPFDFRQPTPIGERIRAAEAQLQRARGYDHHWLLDTADGRLTPAARLEDPGSGRVLEIETTEPGIQFYSGNFLDGSQLGRSGQALRQSDGLCLETQHAPDSPNRGAWPSTVLRPGELFRSCTVYRFDTDG
jgi:aldose 1-epimerase